MFSNAPTIADTAAVLEGVRILSESDDLVRKLWDNTEYLKKRFKELGFNTGNSKTPITPVMLGDEELSLKFSIRLMEENVFASSIRFPMVPKGTARIRVIPSAAHEKKDLDFGIAAFEKIGRELKVI
jgi:glycine C-acetyltransferase